MHHCGIPRRSQPMRADQILAEYFRGVLLTDCIVTMSLTWPIW